MAEGDQNGPGSMIDDGNQGNDAKMFVGGKSDFFHLSPRCQANV